MRKDTVVIFDLIQLVSVTLRVCIYPSFKSMHKYGLPVELSTKSSEHSISQKLPFICYNR